MSANEKTDHNITGKPITIDDFSRVSLNVGKIVEAEAMRGMKKVLRVTVDLGSEKREIAIGVAAYYKPEELVGKTVVVCTNLQQRKIGEMISNGMILAADGHEGKPVLLTVDSLEVPNGAAVH
ncbi:MAG: methionine--tRNA ligase [Nitrososphaeraceae archaeon]|nr:methionine--tRNA ligase [Nitrososphaeraceae archaeon]MDW0331342.1 methionine--tRNA ligase [Nitrososphaeraceae archaeon]